VFALAMVLQGYGAAGRADDRTGASHDHHGSPVSGGPLRQACGQLASSLSAPDTVFTSSASVAAGVLKLAGKDIPAHCLLTGKMFERVSPVDGQTYAIGFEMRLPLDWSGRFFYQGNGGIDGSVVPATGNTNGGGPLTSALLQGFVVISSDAGHSGAQNPSQNPFFGIDPQARLDYGYQAVGKLTPMAKRVIRAAYGKRPDRSYVGGCSNGGATRCRLHRYVINRRLWWAPASTRPAAVPTSARSSMPVGLTLRISRPRGRRPSDSSCPAMGWSAVMCSTA
jgi:feruloyl esterase